MSLSIRSSCARGSGREMAQIPIRIAYSVRTGPVQFQDFTLSGVVTPNLVAISSPNYGLLTPEQLQSSKTLTFQTSPEVASIELREHPRWWMSSCRVESGVARVELVCRTPESLGEFDDVLEWVPKNRDGTVLPTCQVRLRGEVVNDPLPTPRVLVFGRHPVGQTVEQQFAIRSLTGKTYRVEKIVSEHPGCVVTQETDSTDPLVWKVSQRIVEPGQVIGKSVLHLLNTDNERIRVDVPVTYFGYPLDESTEAKR